MSRRSGKLALGNLLFSVCSCLQGLDITGMQDQVVLCIVSPGVKVRGE